MGGDLIICEQKTVNFWQPSLTGANWIQKNLLHYASKNIATLLPVVSAKWGGWDVLWLSKKESQQDFWIRKKVI